MNQLKKKLYQNIWSRKIIPLNIFPGWKMFQSVCKINFEKFCKLLSLVKILVFLNDWNVFFDEENGNYKDL